MTYFSDRHAAAVLAVDAWIAGKYAGSSKATPAQLNEHGLGTGFEGWIIPIRPDVRIVLAVDPRFPFSRPKTAFSGLPQIRLGPHVEADQRLCTWGDDASTATGSPDAIAEAYIQESIALLIENESGGDVADFSIDFEAYWRRSVDFSINLLSLVPLRPPSRFVVGSYGEGEILLAETASEADRWLKNRSGKNKARQSRTAGVIWLDPLPRPDEYPTDIPAFRRLLEKQAPDAVHVLDHVLSSSDARRALLLAGPATPKRNAAGGLIVDQGRQPRSFNKALPAHRGFRKGHVPPDVIGMRSRLRRSEVQQVDAAWTRLENGVFQALRERRVAVLGCGSLGAGVARLLAQTGVGRLVLVDPDALRWENIGRHELGANEVGTNKATSLATHLRARLPHLLECEGYDKDWVRLALSNDSLFDGCDVVVSAMADWVGESALDDFARSRPLNAPVVYGWLERRAMAAHAVALTKDGACFKCGFDERGDAQTPATFWFKDEDNEQCAAPTSPYGATELSFAQALVSGLIIDLLLGRALAPAYRVWLARTVELERQGGAWSHRWKDNVGDPGHGAFIAGAEWPQREGCTCA